MSKKCACCGKDVGVPFYVRGDATKMSKRELKDFMTDDFLAFVKEQKSEIDAIRLIHDYSEVAHVKEDVLRARMPFVDQKCVNSKNWPHFIYVTFAGNRT